MIITSEQLNEARSRMNEALQEQQDRATALRVVERATRIVERTTSGTNFNAISTDQRLVKLFNVAKEWEPGKDTYHAAQALRSLRADTLERVLTAMQLSSRYELGLFDIADAKRLFSEGNFSILSMSTVLNTMPCTTAEQREVVDLMLMRDAGETVRIYGNYGPYVLKSITLDDIIPALPTADVTDNHSLFSDPLLHMSQPDADQSFAQVYRSQMQSWGKIVPAYGLRALTDTEMETIRTYFAITN